MNKVVGARNALELNFLLTKTAMVRRLKKDVLKELPPKRRQKVPLEVASTKEMKEIRKGDAQFSGSFIAGSENRDPTGMQSMFKQMAQLKIPAVKEYILEVLERGDDKAIIFAHHQIMLDAISELLEKRLAKDGLHHIRIDGKTAGNKRHDLVKAFQTDPTCRIALLSITACGEGLTLTAAGLVIFAELYWVPGAIEQAEARAHRIGTTHNAVVIEFLVVPDTPDERIYNSLERKKKDTSKVLNAAEESLGALERLGRKRARALVEERGQGQLEFGVAKKPCLASTVDKPVAVSEASPTVDASEVTVSPAPKRSADESAVSGDIAASGAALETPPPVSKVERWKVEHLLRGAKG